MSPSPYRNRARPWIKPDSGTTEWLPAPNDGRPVLRADALADAWRKCPAWQRVADRYPACAVPIVRIPLPDWPRRASTVALRENGRSDAGSSGTRLANVLAGTGAIIYVDHFPPDFSHSIVRWPCLIRCRWSLPKDPKQSPALHEYSHTRSWPSVDSTMNR